MASEETLIEVVVCMGSSCFARGNAHNLAAIETYLANHKTADSVHVTGCLCQDDCKRGPNMTICGERICEVSTAALCEILPGLIEGKH